MGLKFFFVLVLLFYLVKGRDRKLSAILNPGCVKCTSDNILLYVKAEGSNDSVHQIWDFSHGSPTIVFAITSISSTLNITWQERHVRQFIWSEEPIYSFAYSIDEIYEYNDLQDNGYIEDRCPQHIYHLQGQTWKLTGSQLAEEEVMLSMYSEGLHNGNKIIKGHIDIKLDLLPFQDYATQLPHLIHTANSTLIDIALVNLTTSPEFNSSRFALHMVMVSVDPVEEKMEYKMRKSLDDEHTPGIFEIVEIVSPRTRDSGSGGFVQFRPVAYTQRARSVTASTIVRTSDITRCGVPTRSTLDVFYANQHHLLAEQMFVSFGENGDGFYKQYNYTAWSFTAGYGTPPVESFSLFVILVISIGLGVPILLAMSGVVYVFIRSRQRNRPSRLRNEE